MLRRILGSVFTRGSVGKTFTKVELPKPEKPGWRYYLRKIDPRGYLALSPPDYYKGPGLIDDWDTRLKRVAGGDGYEAAIKLIKKHHLDKKEPNERKALFDFATEVLPKVALRQKSELGKAVICFEQTTGINPAAYVIWFLRKHHNPEIFGSLLENLWLRVDNDAAAKFLDDYIRKSNRHIVYQMDDREDAVYEGERSWSKMRIAGIYPNKDFFTRLVSRLEDKDWIVDFLMDLFPLINRCILNDDLEQRLRDLPGIKDYCGILTEFYTLYDEFRTTKPLKKEEASEFDLGISYQDSVGKEIQEEMVSDEEHANILRSILHDYSADAVNLLARKIIREYIEMRERNIMDILSPIEYGAVYTKLAEENEEETYNYVLGNKLEKLFDLRLGLADEISLLTVMAEFVNDKEVLESMKKEYTRFIEECNEVYNKFPLGNKPSRAQRKLVDATRLKALLEGDYKELYEYTMDEDLEALMLNLRAAVDERFTELSA